MAQIRLTSILTAIAFWVVWTAPIPGSCQSPSDQNTSWFADLTLNDSKIGQPLHELVRLAHIDLVMDSSIDETRVSVRLAASNPKDAVIQLLSAAHLKYEFISDDTLVVTSGLKKEAQEGLVASSASVPGLTASNPAKKKMLFGSIEHSESLSALPQSLHAGATYDS